MRNFTDGTTSGFAELPIPVAWMKWRRGDAKLAAIANTAKITAFVLFISLLL